MHTPLPPLDVLLTQYGGVVFRRARQMLRSDAMAQDAVQEVFMRVLTRGEQFRGDSSVLTWIYSVATTYCLQQLRNEKRRAQKRSQIEIEAVLQTRVVESISLQQMLKLADEDTQQLLYLRFVDGMSLEEVGDVCGISRKTVQTRIEAFLDKARAHR